MTLDTACRCREFKVSVSWWRSRRETRALSRFIPPAARRPCTSISHLISYSTANFDRGSGLGRGGCENFYRAAKTGERGEQKSDSRRNSIKTRICSRISLTNGYRDSGLCWLGNSTKQTETRERKGREEGKQYRDDTLRRIIYR